ncbi:hypothetical protein BDR06DRAFT_981177 [Suillus hirtellus]|nr:hypothetical protein BDR06DRAFT_981177 [Suillus hirtellus]
MPNYTTTSCHLQGLSQCCPRVILSKEARVLLTSQHHQKSKGFKTALNDAWLHINKMVKTIASSHHKSIRHVANNLYMGCVLRPCTKGLRFKCLKSNTWNAFFWKKNQEVKDENAQTSSRKGVLQDLLHNYSDKYRELSQDEKDHLVEEYEENKLLKSTGIRISMKSKINDVTQTLKAIENELNSLKCCTSTGTILYMVRGSTDIPLCGIIFATKGVNDFMVSVMNIDDQHLVSKMEGFAIQGMQGAAHNYKNCCSEKWALIRQQINRTLCTFKKIQIHQIMLIFALEEITKVPKATMHKASTSLPKLQMLHDMWKNKLISWRLLDEDKYQWLLQEHNEKVNTGEIVESSCRPCSDKGKKCVQPMEEPFIPHRKKIYKSLDTIESGDEEVNAPHTGTLAPSPSAPSPSSVQPSVSTSAPSPSPPSVQPSMSTSAPSSSSPSASTSAPSTSTASAST